MAMQIRFHITGMMCHGCSGTVEDALLELPSVTDVEIDLDKAQVMLTTDSEITAEQVQAALPEPYMVA